MPFALIAQARPVVSTPLDVVEDMLIQQDIAYDRPAEEEILAELKSSWGTLKLWYRWEETMSTLVFTCALESKISKNHYRRIYPLLAAMNEKLWLGHFDLAGEEGAIMFRYSLLGEEPEDVTLDLLATILEIARTECERFYPAVQAVIWANKSAAEAIDIALFETCGEA